MGAVPAPSCIVARVSEGFKIGAEHRGHISGQREMQNHRQPGNKLNFLNRGVVF